MTYAIDPHRSWLALETAAAAHSDPLCAALITEVRDHMAAEITGQLDPLMATLTADPVYHFWGTAAPMVLTGRDQVAGFYTSMFERGGQQFEVVVEKVMASHSGVVTEGQVKQVYKGSALLEMGMQRVGETALAPDDLWLSNAQLLTVWPNDGDGKLVGEDIYFGVDPMSTLVKISADQLPDYYQL